MACTLLTFPVITNPAVALAIVCFNWAVFTERTQYLPTQGETPSATHVANCICDRARLRVPVDRQRTGQRAEAAVAALARNPPTTATIAFTDGSSIPNPGPCGGGVVLRWMGTNSYEETEIPLGMGDNNKGEMGALHDILAEVLRRIEVGDIPLKSLLVLFSDSMLCVGFLDRGWAFPTWTDLAGGTRLLLRKVKKLIKVALYWIRGHAGIPGNEEADVAAKAGAEAARREIGLEEEEEEPTARCGQPADTTEAGGAPCYRAAADSTPPP